MTRAYKLKIIKFNLDGDPLQHRIFFLTFIEFMEMIFSQYKEPCEVLLDYPKIGGEDKNIMFKKQLVIFCMQTLISTVEGGLLNYQEME